MNMDNKLLLQFEDLLTRFLPDVGGLHSFNSGLNVYTAEQIQLVRDWIKQEGCYVDLAYDRLEATDLTGSRFTNQNRSWNSVSTHLFAQGVLALLVTLRDRAARNTP